jgi:hypothetical protein
VKYLYKYVYKGPDNIMYRLENATDNPAGAPEPAPTARNEINEHVDARVVGASRAFWGIASYKMYTQSPTVWTLDVHLENEQWCQWEDGDERSAHAEGAPDTTLTNWLKYVKTPPAGDPGCRDELYLNFHETHTYQKSTKKTPGGWTKRRNASRAVVSTPAQVGRVVDKG